MSEKNVVVRITADSTQLRQEMDRDIQALRAFANTANETNGTAVAAVRENIALQREHQLALKATTEQMQQLEAVSQQFESRVEAAGTRQAISVNAMSRGFAILSTSASTSVRSIDQVANAVGQLAFGFGETGYLVGAVTMTGIAIFRIFDELEKKIAEVNQKSIETVLHAKDAATIKGAGATLVGDVRETQRELAEAQAKLNGLYGVDLADQKEKVAELEKQLKAEQAVAQQVKEKITNLQVASASEERDRLILTQAAEVRARIALLTKQYLADLQAGNNFAATDLSMLRDAQAAYAQIADNARVLNAEHKAEFGQQTATFNLELQREVAAQKLAEWRATALAAEKAMTAELEKQLKLVGQSAVGAMGSTFTGHTDITGTFQTGKDPATSLGEKDLNPLSTMKPEQLAQLKALGEAYKATAKEAQLLGTAAQVAGQIVTAALTQSLLAIFNGHFDTKKLKKQLLEPMVAQLLGTAITEAALGVAAAAGIATAGEAPKHFAAAENAAMGAAAVGALAGIASIGAGGGRGGSSASASSGQVAAQSNATLGPANNQPLLIDLILRQQAPDGRMISSIRQQIQRSIDKQSPIRVTL
jgi:hypothetical protein